MARDQHTALLFPGQGSQTADMREQVERHRPDLLELAARRGRRTTSSSAPTEGTRWAQPAIFCAALAGWELLKGDPPSRTLMAGHSLGEITALVAAGALERRGRAARWSPPAAASCRRPPRRPATAA